MISLQKPCNHPYRAIKDNHVFKKMAAALDPCIAPQAAQKLVKEVVQRIGRGAVAEFARTLCNRALCRFLPSEHIGAMLKLLVDQGVDCETGQATSALITDAANANPYLFVPLTKQVSPRSIELP